MNKRNEAPTKGSLLVPLLLSCFVFPGVGQLSLGRKRLGAAIILLTNLFLVLFCLDMYTHIQEILPVLIAETENMDFAAKFLHVQTFVHEELDMAQTGFYFFALVSLWLVSILDIIFRRNGINRDVIRGDLNP